MINECFLNNILMISEDYDEVRDVVDSFDRLVGSMSSLQDNLLEEIRERITMNNIEISIKRLESIHSLGRYDGLSFDNLMKQMNVSYAAEFFEDDVKEEVFKSSFIQNITKHTLYLDDEFKVNLLDVCDMLEMLYNNIAEDLCSDIQTLDLDKDSKRLIYVTYLSPRLSKLSSTINEIVEAKPGSYIDDETDLAAVSRMRELLSYDLLKLNESVYFYTGDLHDVNLKDDILSVGTVEDSGYLDMQDMRSPYPVNQCVAITLKYNDINKEDILSGEELYVDDSEVLRIELDALFKRLCVNSNGNFQFIL